MGGSTPNSGNLDLIFQYDQQFGFRQLDRQLGMARSEHVAISTDNEVLRSEYYLFLFIQVSDDQN